MLLTDEYLAQINGGCLSLIINTIKKAFARVLRIIGMR